MNDLQQNSADLSPERRLLLVPARLPNDLFDTPIGQALPNVYAYVLDTQLDLVPIGVPGELYLGGVQLARDYHNRPEITAERFIHDPFGDIPGGWLYRTGDLGRWVPNGKLEFLGRIDHQVKLRGFRIELEEIEVLLCQHEAVKDYIVRVRDERLVAYVVGENLELRT